MMIFWQGSKPTLVRVAINNLTKGDLKMFTASKAIQTNEITNLDDLAQIETPNRDDVSDIFKPVSHFDFVTTIIEGLKDKNGKPRKFIDKQSNEVIEMETTGFKAVVSGAYKNPTEDKTYFGTEIHGSLDINAYRDGKLIQPCNGEMDMKLGFKNSNTSQTQLEMFISALVKVCSNGMIADKVLDSVRRKHTIGMNLAETVDNGLITYSQRFGAIEETADRFRNTEVSSTQLHDVLMNSVKRKLVSWSGMGKVHDEYYSTDHRDKHGEGNLWSVYNAFTEVAKGFSPERQTKVFAGMNDVFYDARVAPKPQYSFN